MAEWILVGITALGMIASIIAVLIKVSIALAQNTDAIKRLTEVMDKQDARIGKIDEAIDNHEGRIIAIETVHRINGCNDEPAKQRA